jgi:hypothetical protein
MSKPERLLLSAVAMLQAVEQAADDPDPARWENFRRWFQHHARRELEPAEEFLRRNDKPAP